MNRADASSWQLEPAPASARAWLFALTVALPIVITGAALGFTGPQDDDLIAGSLAVTLAVLLGGIALFGGAIALVIDRSMRRHRVAVDPDGVEVATTFYRRHLGWGALRLDEARVVDLDEHTGLRPLWKTNGSAFPGFRSGWFRLRNREKALVAMLRGPRVAWIPTTQGYGLLLQPRQPQALLDHLRASAPHTR